MVLKNKIPYILIIVTIFACRLNENKKNDKLNIESKHTALKNIEYDNKKIPIKSNLNNDIFEFYYNEKRCYSYSSRDEYGFNVIMIR